jgi:hypothetical protein
MLKSLVRMNNGANILSYLNKDEGRKVCVDREMKESVDGFVFIEYEDYVKMLGCLRRLVFEIGDRFVSKRDKCVIYAGYIEEASRWVSLKYIKEKLADLYVKPEMLIVGTENGPPLFVPSLSLFMRTTHTLTELHNMDFKSMNIIEDEKIEFHVREMRRMRQANYGIYGCINLNEINGMKTFDSMWRDIVSSVEVDGWIRAEDVSKVYLRKNYKIDWCDDKEL